MHLEVDFLVVPVQEPLRGAQHGGRQRQLPRRSPCSRLEFWGFGLEIEFDVPSVGATSARSPTAAAPAAKHAASWQRRLMLQCMHRSHLDQQPYETRQTCALQPLSVAARQSCQQQTCCGGHGGSAGKLD